MTFLEERFDSLDGHTYDEASFLSQYGQSKGARLWATARERHFRLGSTTIDLHAAAERGETALLSKNGSILAVIFRNVDGARGRHCLASAGIRLADSNVPQDLAMAGPNRTSSLTTGATTMDVFKTLYNGTADERGGTDVLRLARTLVEILERQKQQANSLIFRQEEVNLECTMRAHAFSPADPSNAPYPSTVERMHSFLERRESDEREGGRMHGHVDQPGTDGARCIRMCLRALCMCKPGIQAWT